MQPQINRVADKKQNDWVCEPDNIFNIKKETVSLASVKSVELGSICNTYFEFKRLIENHQFLLLKMMKIIMKLLMEKMFYHFHIQFQKNILTLFPKI